MATIFRGPTFASPQRKPPQPSVFWTTGLLVPALLLSGSVPFKTPVPQVTPQHPSHTRSANADTSHGTPKTLYADAVRPTFNPPHKAPDRLWPVTDTTSDTPLACIVGPPPKPFFNAPTVTPDRVRAVADTSQDTPLPMVLAALNAPKPFASPPGLTVPTPRVMLTPDTSRGMAKVLYADPAVAPPFVNAPSMSVHLWRVQADTSKGSFALADSAVATAQLEFLPAPPMLRIGSETSLGSPPALLGQPAVVPPLLNTLARVTFSNQQKTKGNLGSETTRGTPQTLVPVTVQAPFANPPTLRVDPRFSVVDTSEGTAKVLYEDAARPFRTRPILRAPELRRGLADTSSGVPATLGAVAPPFVNAPVLAIGQPRILGDTSQSTPKALYSDAAVAFFNPPQIQVDRQRPVADTSHSAPAQLLASGFVQPPFVNPPHLAPVRVFWQPADTSVGIDEAPALLAPFSNLPQSVLPRLLFQPFDASEGTPKTLYGDAVAPSFNPPSLQLDRIRPVTDTSSAWPKVLYADAVSPFFNPPQHAIALPRLGSETSSGTQADLFPAVPFANPPTLQVDRIRSVADTSSGTFPGSFPFVPPAPVFNAPQFQVAPVRIVSETSQSTSQALLSVPGIPFAQRDWTVAAEYRRQYLAKWDQPQFTPDAYPPPLPEVVVTEDSGGIWKQRNALRRYVAEQQAFEQAKRERKAAEKALRALALEETAAAERVDAIRRVRETAAAHKAQLDAMLAAKAALDAETKAASEPKPAEKPAPSLVASPPAPLSVAEVAAKAAQTQETQVAPIATPEQQIADLRAQLDRANRKVAALMALLLKS